MTDPLEPAPTSGQPSAVPSRRRFLQLGAAGAVVLGGGAAGVRLLDGGPGPARSLIGPSSAAVEKVEAARSTTGRVVRRTLRAAPATVDLGGRTVQTWAYDGVIPGQEIRAKVGDELRVTLTNGLPADTTVHWHGLALRNDMDGVPGVTQKPVASGTDFEYSFVLPHPGSYFFHSHVGTQLDRGLMAPLVIEDPAEPGDYDEEVVLVLDDWTDGLGTAPDDLVAQFRRNGMSGMSGMSGGMGQVDPQQPLGEDTGDVVYPAHLINGRLPTAPVRIDSGPGRRIRLRLVNSGADTAYRFAIGGHRLTVTHSDGFPVRPVEVDSLVIGMGERYDVVLRTGDGAFPIVAIPEGKDDPGGFAVLRTASGSVPAPDTRPAELGGRLLTYADLSPADAVALPARQPERKLDLVLQMGDGGRQWLINGKAFPDRESLDIRAGERVRLVMRNQTMMFHPMHLHGHTFAVADRAGRGLRKDTIDVLPMQTVSVDFEADNPGQWLVHCHNLYHLELGMASVVSYVQ